MSFLYPEFLYIFIPLFVFFGYLLLKKESQAHFFSDEVMSRLRVSAKSLSLKVRNILFMIMSFFIIIALAQPVINEGTVKIQAKSADIMIALDISDSMLADDIYPNRLKSAKQKALALLKYAPNERIGIMAFAKSSYLVSPLSFDHKAVSFLLRQLDTNSITQKGTDFLSILDVVSKTENENVKKYLLILSDGGDKNNFTQEIQKAKENGIVVFVLGIGTKKGTPIKQKDGTFIKYKGDIIVSKLNENISDLAVKTGGVYIQSVKSNKDIKTMLSEIVNNSEEKELKSEEVQKHTQFFYYPLGFAILLFMIATSSMYKKATSLSLFILFTMLLASPSAKADLFDFMDIKDAKEAYHNKKYKKSAKLYEKYAEQNQDASGYYNAANAFYKQKKYDKALDAYQKTTFEDKNLEAKRLANMGNAFARRQKPDGLKKAVESYEKSLKIKEDKNTRENLEEVKKLIKKNNQKKKGKNKKSKNKNKSQDSKDGEKSDDKNSSDKNKSEDAKENSSQKNDSKDKQDSSKSRNSKDNKKSSDEMKSKKESEENSNKKKDDLEKLSKDKGEKKDKDKDKKGANVSSVKENSAKKMSDAEEKKWLKELNLQKNTYLYRLGKQKQKGENNDEKPW